jgi:hypothetical protein
MVLEENGVPFAIRVQVIRGGRSLADRHMAIPRKRALQRLDGLTPPVEDHLAKIAAKPADRAVEHWKAEVANWLRQMEELLPHAGKKTADEWRRRIQDYRKALEG